MCDAGEDLAAVNTVAPGVTLQTAHYFGVRVLPVLICLGMIIMNDLCMYLFCSNEVQIILDELRSVTIEDLKYRGVRGVGDNVETPPHLWSKAFRRPVRMIEEMTYYK